MKKTPMFLLMMCSVLILGVHALNLGTVKGYVLNNSGIIETGSNVSISVLGCSGTGCSANTTTDANGFYIKSNLNIIPGNSVMVSGQKGNSFGNATGIATGSGSVGVAIINVTMCTAPQMPVLSAVSNSHSNALVTMSWTTFKTGGEFDEFVFDSNPSNTSAISPQIKSNVAYQIHTWKVRTCSGSCCSDYATNTFNISNNLPVAPTLIDQGNTNQNTITFNWTHPGTDPDGDTVSFEFIFDGVTTASATAPHIVSGISSGSHTWGVRACDGISCTAFTYDSFTIGNGAPATPTVVDQPHTTDTTVSLQWTNYTDPENDQTENELQVSTDANFTTLIANYSYANSSQQVSSLATLSLYYWRVRTCDTLGACSAYASDSFFIYTAGGTTTITQGGKTKTINETCTPEWVCGDWNMCSSPGISTRNCFDKNDCVNVPPTGYQMCSYQGQAPPKPSQTQKYFIGDFKYSDVYQAKLGMGEKWELVYNDIHHQVSIISAESTGITIEVASQPKQYFILFNQDKEIDIDEDGISDIVVRITQSEGGRYSLVFELIKKPEQQLPLTTTTVLGSITKTFSQGGMFPWFLLLIIVALLGIIYYQYGAFIQREIKTDKALEQYVHAALEKGFAPSQIRSRLLMSGFASEEVSYVFKKMKLSDDTVQKEQ